MDLLNLTFEERLDLMRKRQAFLSQLTEGCTTFDDFIAANDEKLAVMGINLSKNDYADHHISLRLDFAYNEYETYYVVHSEDGRLKISNIISWQNDACCNEFMDISGPKRYVNPDEW